MDNTYQFSFFFPGDDKAEMVTAELSGIGFTGFETTDNRLDAFIPEKDFDETSFNGICKKYGVTACLNIIAPENWNQVWESNFEPVQVDDFCMIRAGFHKAANNTQYEIVITPKMSFGTGHHATTYMMIQLMRDIGFNDQTVCDMGCGTGVLAILAHKMGAKSVLAVDYDGQCIINSKENFDENNCQDIDLQKSDQLPAGQWNIILANINLNVLSDNMSAFVNALLKEGQLLLSGILETDLDQITDILSENELRINKILNRNGWLAIAARKG